MKCKLILAALSLIFAFSLGINAQNYPALDAYNNWKSAASAKINGDIGTHYALISTTQRLSEQSAIIHFLSVGKLPKLELEVTPLFITRGTDGQVINTIRGEKAVATQALDNSTKLKDPKAELTITIPVGIAHNALEVNWNIDVDGKKATYSLTLPLENEQLTSVLGIIL